MANGNLEQITAAVEDAITFPILTQGVEGYGAHDRGAPGGGAAGGPSLGKLARDTIRSVLGWRYRTEDPKGFKAALTKAFALREAEGHVQWEFKPQNYMVQADLGEITGAQASIHVRTKVAVDHALPLLEGLTPLREDSDDEDTEAMRAIVRTELTELVQELGKVGGPRVQRVESIFTLLLGMHPNTGDPEKVGGQLAELRSRFGLERKRVNTVAEEQNLTNFLIVVDYVNSLHVTWRAQSKYLDRRGTAEPFLGTQLVLLSQTLDVIAESIQEAYAAMDSVYFGAAERGATLLRLNGEPPITVSELLGWVETFATSEGRQLIQDAGKDGVVAFRATLEQLRKLVDLALGKSREASGNPTRGFHTARVQRAFEETRIHLDGGLRLIREIRSPDQTPTERTIIERCDPEELIPKQGAELTIIGERLQKTASVYLLGGDRLKPVMAEDPPLARGERKLTARFNLSGADPGSYNLILQDDDGQRTSLEGAVTITHPPPQITAIAPTVSEQEAVVRVKVCGVGFDDRPVVLLRPRGTQGLENELGNHRGVLISPVTPTKITAVFDLSFVLEGKWEVIVINANRQVSNPMEFRVDLPQPVIESFTPLAASPGEPISLVIRGRYFPTDTSSPQVALQPVLLLGGGVPKEPVVASSVNVESTSRLTATIPRRKVVLPGQYHLTVAFKDRAPVWGEKPLQVWPDLDDLLKTFGSQAATKLNEITTAIGQIATHQEAAITAAKAIPEALRQVAREVGRGKAARRKAPAAQGRSKA